MPVGWPSDSRQLGGGPGQPGGLLGLLPGRGQDRERLQPAGHAEPLAAGLTDPQALGQPGPGQVEVAAGQRDPAHPGQAAGDLQPGVHLTEDLRGVLEVPHRHISIAPGPGQRAQPVLDLRDPPAVVVASSSSAAS